MRLTTPIFVAAFCAVIAAATPAFCQTADAGAEPAAMPTVEGEAAPRVFLVLSAGGRFEADEVSEKPEGFWYRQGSVWTLIDRARVARVEREVPEDKMAPSPDSAAASPARWSLSDAGRVETFFRKKFGRPLPVTAYGQSGLHTRWGYDHRYSMDVGLHPDSAEGKALIAFLSGEGIPFLGFRTAIPGVASAPHIHVGFPSRRLTPR